MEIKILNLIEGAKQATGLTVIIDVFRAFSTSCYAFENGAKKIIPVGDINLAYEIKKQNQEYLLIGERNGIKPEGFDYGNSPTQIENISFENKTLILTTSAGSAQVLDQVEQLTDDACRYSKTCPWRGDPPAENCIADPAVPCVVPEDDL